MQSVEQERATDEAESGRASDAVQHGSMGGSTRPAESETERLAGILSAGESVEGISGARRTRPGTRQAFSEKAAQGVDQERRRAANLIQDKPGHASSPVVSTRQFPREVIYGELGVLRLQGRRGAVGS